MEKFTITAREKRLDKFLSTKFPAFSRSQIQTFINNGQVKVNGTITTKPALTLEIDDKVKITDFSIPEINLKKETFQFPIAYEDEALVVIDKPAGITVHPSKDGKNISGTVANAAAGIFKGEAEDDLRPGIVHRLDKNTSGLLILAKTPEASKELIKQFKEHKVIKNYFALVVGQLAHQIGIINSPIGRSPQNRKKMAILPDGKEAITKYKVLKEYKFERQIYSYLQIQLQTGRTHQIRVHLDAIDHPIVGDDLYGNPKANKVFAETFDLTRQFLHAASLKFTSPATKKEVSLLSPLPPDLQETINHL